MEPVGLWQDRLFNNTAACRINFKQVMYPLGGPARGAEANFSVENGRVGLVRPFQPRGNNMP